MRQHQFGNVQVFETAWGKWTVQHPCIRMTEIDSETVAVMLASGLSRLTDTQIRAAKADAIYALNPQRQRSAA